MARIIRCPNCGENVEVPPNPTGQMVTCIACGTVLRLKSKKDAFGPKGELPKGDASAGSMSGSMSGSLSATTITPPFAGNDPPSLASACDVCGRELDASDLVEDRGTMTCRACLKKPLATGDAPRKPSAKTSKRNVAKGRASDDGLIPLADDGAARPAQRGKMFTVGAPLIGGCVALGLFVGCELFLAFFPKPVGSRVIATNVPDAPVVRTEPPLVAPPAVETTAPEPTTLPVTPSSATKHAPLVPPVPNVQVADAVAVKRDTVFDDEEARITEKLTAGLETLRTALAARGDASVAPAKEALLQFSEARTLLQKEKRNAPTDAGWSLSNHGSAVAYVLLRNEPYALDYLGRLPAPPDAAATINRAVLILNTREDKSEAIAMLVAHLQSDAGADDAYALNLLGTTLAGYSADAIQKDTSLAAALVKYREFVEKQAKKHPGERRWGVRWIPQATFDAKEGIRRDAARLEISLRGPRATIAKNKDATTDVGKVTLERATALEQEYLAKLEPLRAELSEPWLTADEILPVLPDVSAFNASMRSASTTRPALVQ